MIIWEFCLSTPGFDGGTRSVASAYVANELNQYEARTVPGLILNTGTARTDAVVVVGLTNQTAILANRHGTYYWQAVPVDNDADLVLATNVVRAYVEGVVGTNTNSLVRCETREVLVPETPEDFAYDADGNLLSDGLWSYSWDGENRLIGIESAAAVPDPMKKRLTFAYDHQARRVKKCVYEWDSGDWSLVTDHFFIYDGWNLLCEISDQASQITTNTYLWGLDLSGTLQGAGGIGGLLCIRSGRASPPGEPFFPAYDGNGNVMALVSTSGTIVATYEYDPFGNLISEISDLEIPNPFKFSTKYHDDETDLDYYGFRFYSPQLGRWLSHDPAEEENPGNLYGFVDNAPVINVDPLGDTILSMDVKGTGASEVEAIFPGSWHILSDDFAAGYGPNLGYHGGIQTVVSFPFNYKTAAGLWKFEARAEWCDDVPSIPEWKFYASNVKIFYVHKKTTYWIKDAAAEVYDGPTGRYVSKIDPKLKLPSGNYLALAYDAPRVAGPSDKARKYYLKGDWRIELSDAKSKWESKIHLQFYFDDDDPSAGKGLFNIVEAPHAVK